MSDSSAEVAILEDIITLPANMQKIYLQLVSAIDNSVQGLKDSGVNPEQLSETFIEDLVERMLKNNLPQATIDEIVNAEFLRRLLAESELSTVS